MPSRLSSSSGPQEERNPDSRDTLRKEIQQLEKLGTLYKARKSSSIIGCVIAGAGVLCFVVSIVSSSNTFAFIGMWLTFWGGLLLFIRPHNYVRSDLLDSTALSSLRTIDRVLVGLGYMEKGVYIPAANAERILVFVPSGPFTRIPKAEEIDGHTFIENPKGIVMVPPGLSLATLVERELGVDFSKCSLETLRRRLRKLLIEDLEIARGFEMQFDGSDVRLRFVDSIYSGFCAALRSTKVSWSLGCPICSAMACILAMTTQKPISFIEETSEGRAIESSYRMMEV